MVWRGRGKPAELENWRRGLPVRRVEACCAAGGLLVDGETGGGANGDRRRRPYFGQRREEEDEGRAGFAIMEKFRGLTEKQNFLLI